MKFRLSALFVAMFAFCFATITTAQDDLYYNPADDNSEVTYNNYEVEEVELADVEDVDEYEYLDDYDYHYSSRIRRFSRPSSFGYYDPFFTDAAYYNGLLTPGASIYVGNPYSYASYRRALRNNALFGSPFAIGFNNPYGRTSAYSPFINPRGFGGGFGFNNPYGRSAFGGGYNAFCPPTSYGTSRTVNNTARGASNNTYGPRGTSSTRSRSYDSSVRRGTTRNTESVRGTNSSSRSRSSSTRSNTTRRTYDRGSNNSSSRRSYTPSRNSSSRTYSTPRSSSSRRSYSAPRSSSSRSYSAPRSSSRSSSSSRRY